MQILLISGLGFRAVEVKEGYSRAVEAKEG